MAVPTQSADLERTSQQAFQAADSASLSFAGNVLTIECLVKFESVPQAGVAEMFFVNKWTGGQEAYSFEVYWTGSAIMLSFAGRGSGGVQSFERAWTPSTGVWYHVAVVVNGTSGKFFIDGVQQGSTATITNITNYNDTTAPLDIGQGSYAGASPTQWLDGRISMVRIWSVDRSGNLNSCEILGATAGLVAEWTLDNTLNDNSGNGNTLSNINSATFGADVSSICVGAAVNSGMFAVL